MKKFLACAVAAALVLTMAALAEADGDPTQRFSGRWQDPDYGRAALTIMRCYEVDAPEDELWFDAKLTWGDSASSEGVWYMSARYDGAADSLVYTDGVMAMLVWNEDGEIESEDNRWTDAEGSFTLADGKLLWTDSREERAREFAFEPMARLAPEAEELRDRYFRAVAGLERGTAGSSLKAAALAADLLSFAWEYRMWYADVPALRANMLDAWLMLDDGERQRFDENLPAVSDLLEDATSYYEPVSGLFEDAGVKNMAALAEDQEARASWAALLGNTYTLGNEE